MKNLFFINSKSVDAKFANIIQRTLFGFDYFIVDENQEAYSNNELFQLETYTDFYFIDVLPDLQWVQDIISALPQMNFNVYSKAGFQNHYSSVLGNVHVELIGSSTISSVLHNNLKMNFLSQPSLADKNIALYFQMDMLVQFFEKYCKTFGDSVLDSRCVNAYTNVSTLINSLNGLSNQELVNYISRLTVHSRENSSVVIESLTQMMMKILSKSIESTFSLYIGTENEKQITLKYFNVSENDYQLIDNLITRKLKFDFPNDDNLFLVFFEVINFSTIKCAIKHSKTFVTPLSLEEGQDTIDYITTESFMIISDYVAAKFGKTITLNTDGTLSFEVSLEEFGSLQHIVIPPPPGGGGVGEVPFGGGVGGNEIPIFEER